MGPDIAVQTAIRSRLIQSQHMRKLAHGCHILDRISRPITAPGIVVGDATMVDEGASLERCRWRITHNVHVWLKDSALENCKVYCEGIRLAMREGRLDLADPYHCIDWRVGSVRTMADPDGEMAHGVVALTVHVEEDLS